jgi:WS/DGAT/MGAT family acyltransferase
VLAAQGVQVVNKLVFSHNPPNALDQNPGVAKLAAWSQPFPLTTVKAAGRQAGATVNDVLMSALAGAISTYLAEQNRPVADLSTMVPVNVRRPDGLPLADLGNRFALVFLRLPMGAMAWRDRLVETKRRMDGIKHSPESAITFTLINVIGRLHPTVERWLVDFFAGKAVGVTTNVAGPAIPRYLAGARVTGVLAWVPGSGRQNLGVCIVTYDQTVRIGFKVDAGAIPDPDRLVDAFNRELEQLLSQTSVSA